jgi:UDP-N-acetylmuramoyl-tripeptide--D-alanyl-D-alanine ligase
MAYSIDTRTLKPGDTYVAIVGETHDGHSFIEQALDAGATGIVTEQDVSGAVRGRAEVTRVDSTMDWITQKASAKVREIGPRIVAITGSVGKTTTRSAVVAVLREAFPVVSAEGNLNTPLGLSLMVLNADITPETVVVMEMGARLQGDLRELTTLFPPTVSVITTVKGVHLETFGTLDGIQQEKGELVAALGASGTAVLNADDPRVRAMQQRNAGRTLFYGTAEDADLTPDLITAELPILGAHAVYTALAALGAARALGMTDDAINAGLAKIQPEKGRLVRLQGRAGSTLIDDTYNASPDATVAALEVMAGLGGTRRVAFLGDMLELGADEIDQHRQVLDAARTHADLIFAVGPIMKEATTRLADASKVTPVASAAALADAICAGDRFVPQRGDVLLVKGSQGTRMERVSEALLDPDLDPAEHLPRQSAAWKAK